MHVDALLCNHAEAVNNLLYLSGAGVNLSSFPPGAPPPYAVHVGLALQVTVPWTDTNQQHDVHVDLVDQDGRPVRVPTPGGTVDPFVVDMTFNVGRPPGLQPGDEQTVAMAANLVGVPFPAAGRYEFVISVDGTPERRLAFRLQAIQGLPVN